MGNSCCPPSNPCDHTVDETKGLLSSSESKNSTKAEGIEEVSFNPPEVAEESKNVEEPEKEVVTDQPVVDHKAQSSYSNMMNTLHTEVSLAAQATQSSSLEASQEQVESAIEIPETKKDCRIQNVQTSDDALPDSVKAPAKMVTAEETSETKAQITNVENLDKSAVTALVVQEGPADTKAPLEISEKDINEEASEVEVQREVADMGVQKNAAAVKVQEEAAEVKLQEEAAEVKIQEEAAEVEVQEEAADVVGQKEALDVKVQEASVMDIQNKAAKMEVQMQVTTLEVQEEAAVMEVQKEAPEEEVQEKAAKMEVPMQAADVDVEKVVDHVDEQKEAAEDDLQRKAAELDTNKEEAEVDVQKNISEEKPKAPVDVLIEKDSTQTKQQTLNESTTEKHAVEHQFPMEISQNSNKADMTVTENGEAKSSSELDVVKKHVPTKAITEEPVGEPADKVEDRFVEDIASDTAEEKEDSLLSETQEHSGVLTSPADKISNEVTPHTIENGQRDDLKDKNPPNVDVALVPEMPQETELVQKTLEESSRIECKAQQEQETSANMSSTVQEVEKSEDAAADQEMSAEYLLNGLDSSTPVEKTEYKDARGDTIQVENVEPEREAILLNDRVREDEEPELQLSEKEKTTVQEPVEKEDAESLKGHQGENIVSSSHAVEVALIPVSEKFLEEEEEQQQRDEDLYLGAEEIEEKRHKEKPSKPLLEFTIPGVEERCSLAAAVDILAYSEREWKGNTAKSTLIRKGYSEMSCSFSGLRRVRGDNYCALRATLFQVLATTTQTPDWLQEEDFTSLPEKLEAQEHLIHGWKFPEECRKVGEKENAVEKLKHYMQLLQKRWQAAADSVSLEERQRLCECVFQSGEEEYGLLEVLKFLMLARAVELHYQMQAGQEVPVFCWLLFARDTSENPKTLLNNHLSQIGFSGGLEQVEMFLLGYALQHTIQTFRLYKMDTEEFVTHYPDDHKQDWPCVCIVTEDDRHYNVPIRKRAQHQLNPDFSVPWPDLS